MSLHLFKRLFDVAWQRMADYRYWASIVASATPPPVKKYYAVIRGEMKGVFTDAERFKKATENYPNQLARVFDNESEALSWFHLVRSDADTRKQQAKQSRKERWDLQNDVLLTAASPSLGAKKYYAVARGFKTGIFIRNSEYLRAIERFPDALARSFKTREEAEAWLHDPTATTTIPTITSKKYYAVARGKITGIFTDVEMYNKATKGFPNAVAQAFKTEDEAKTWLKLFKNENLPSGIMAKRAQKKRWARENVALLAANRASAPIAIKSSKEIQHTSDPNELLATRLEKFFGPLLKPSIGSVPEETPDSGFKPETLDFLAFGRTHGYDYVAACKERLAMEWTAWASRHQDKIQSTTPKQIAAAWMKEASIPSSYKLLVNNLVSVCYAAMLEQKSSPAITAASKEQAEKENPIIAPAKKTRLAWERDETLLPRARRDMCFRLIRQEDTPKSIAEFRYLEHAETIPKLLEGVPNATYEIHLIPWNEEQFVTCPPFGVYDVADGMHFLLACVFEEGLGQAFAWEFHRSNQRVMWYKNS